MISRRGLLGTFVTIAAGIALDPEKLLWTPGKKTIFIPYERVTKALIGIDLRNGMPVYAGEVEFTGATAFDLSLSGYEIMFYGVTGKLDGSPFWIQTDGFSKVDFAPSLAI